MSFENANDMTGRTASIDEVTSVLSVSSEHEGDHHNCTHTLRYIVRGVAVYEGPATKRQIAYLVKRVQFSKILPSNDHLMRLISKSPMGAGELTLTDQRLILDGSDRSYARGL